MKRSINVTYRNKKYGFTLFSDTTEKEVFVDAILTDEDAKNFGYKNTMELIRAITGENPLLLMYEYNSFATFVDIDRYDKEEVIKQLLEKNKS